MSKRILTTGVAACLALCAGTARAQDIDLAAGQTELTYKGIEANANAGLWVDRGALSQGDSRRDMIIGAPGIPGLLGHVYVIYGGPVRTGDLVLSSADAIITGKTTGDLFGTAGASGNIVTSEGTSQRELVIGAPGSNSGRGAVYVFKGGSPLFGSNSQFDTDDARFTILGAPGDQLGSAIATADLDHDNFREIIIGAPGNNRIYVIRGGAGLAGTRDLSNPAAADLVFGGPGFGRVLAAGDVTGDGFYDLVVGAPSQNQVHLYRGQTGPLLPTFPTATYTYSAAIDDQVGASVRIADINEDNISDLLIGAPLADGPFNSRVNCGAVFVMWGSADPNALSSRDLSQARVTFWGQAPGQQLGSYVTSGNANRDGVDDLVMIAAGGSNGSGELLVYYGRSTSGFGADLGDGRRQVDFANASNVDRKIFGLGSASAGLFRTAQIFELTGEGAGDIVAGVPTRDSHTGVLYFTVSPKFTLSSQNVTVTVNDNVVTPVAVTISNPSLVGVTWALSSNRSWITLSGNAGSVDRSTPAPVTLYVNSSGMGLGTYTGTVTLTSTSKHLEMLLQINVTLNRIPLAAPAFVTATPAANGVGLRWEAVPGATSYIIRRIDANGSSTVIATGVTGNSFTDQIPLPAAGVRYTVSSNNSSATSGESVSATVPFGVAGSRTPTVMTARDYDNDGKVDVGVYRSSNGGWFVNRSSNATLLSHTWGAPSLADQPVPADYDGDGKADIAVYRTTTGEWFILRSSNGSLMSQTWGSANFADIPVPADYDNDGKADIAIYRGSTGEWFILRSSNGSLLKQSWGAPSLGDIPVPADYDGDGKADIGIYRGSTGEWFILRSSNGSLLKQTWGAPSLGDVPVPEDYDEDGKADVGIYRATSGQWIILKSGGGTIQQQWGSPALGDVPVAGDFDGDGKADIAIYRFSSGQWFILRSANGALMQFNWGAPSLGDSVRFY